MLYNKLLPPQQKLNPDVDSLLRIRMQTFPPPHVAEGEPLPSPPQTDPTNERRATAKQMGPMPQPESFGADAVTIPPDRVGMGRVFPELVEDPGSLSEEERAAYPDIERVGQMGSRYPRLKYGAPGPDEGLTVPPPQWQGPMGSFGYEYPGTPGSVLDSERPNTGEMSTRGTGLEDMPEVPIGGAGEGETGRTRFPYDATSPPAPPDLGGADWLMRATVEGMPADMMLKAAMKRGLGNIDNAIARLEKAMEEDTPMDLPDPVVLQYRPSFLTRLGAGLRQRSDEITAGYRGAAEFTARARQSMDEMRVQQEGFRQYRKSQMMDRLAQLDADRGDLIAEMMQARVDLSKQEAAITNAELSADQKERILEYERALQDEDARLTAYSTHKQGVWGSLLTDFQLGIGTTYQPVLDEMGQPTEQMSRVQGQLSTAADVDRQYEVLVSRLRGMRPSIGEKLYGMERAELDAVYQRLRANFADDAAAELRAAQTIEDAANDIVSRFAEPLELSDAFTTRGAAWRSEFDTAGVTDYLESEEAIEDAEMARRLRNLEGEARRGVLSNRISEREAADQVFTARAAADISELVQRYMTGKRKRPIMKKEVDLMVLMMAKDGGRDTTLRALRVPDSWLDSVRAAYEKKYEKAVTMDRTTGFQQGPPMFTPKQ